jgi:serine/threonine protein kinase
MSSATQVCDIVLPGYTLADRIGAGGYAEVWRAEAPGGIQKAVKLVHGYYDDEFAAQELKALERVKGVRHPFLLSLERFEIINGRLAILTELADMSLDQRLRQCRAEGLPGIPREELLRYMADAAEAIDFLSQRHQLLHLDIKPENLLVLGDHIKVADFGLVKELATRTQNSLVSGMTPTYASPEMFDDNPSIHSDQYSLAIVYQEMLVGTLPFPGRTAAQLAKQHTQAEPQLASLPVSDRPIVARALAKQPADRYPSCRAFVDALMHRAEAKVSAAPIEVPKPAPIAPAPAKPEPDDTKPSSFSTTLRRAPGQSFGQTEAKVTQPVQRATKEVETPKARIEIQLPIVSVPEETVDIDVPEASELLQREQPTLYVAIGGVGIQVLCRLRALLTTRSASDESNALFRSVALDTDRDELRDACSGRWKAPLAPEDTLHLPLRLPKSYDNSREILGWLSRRWLYNIPRSLETRGYRPLGRVALVDNAQRLLTLFDQKLQQLALATGSPDASGQPREAKTRVVVLAGTGGGTGAGMVIDVANAARSLAASRNLQMEVHAFLVCTCLPGTNSSPLVAANTYSLLTELNHATAFGNQSTAERTTQNAPFESRTAPFDCVYCVPAQTCSASAHGADALDVAARYLALETTPEARGALRSCRASQTPREKAHAGALALKTVALASFDDQKHEFIGVLAADLAEAIKQHWLTIDKSNDWERLVRDEQRAVSTPKLAAAPEGEPGTPRAVVPVNDATPLALRGRFKEYVGLEFTSEVLRQIQNRLESRDDRGRPIITARDAKLIADSARTAVASLVGQVEQQTSGSRFSNSPRLRSFITEGSQRIVRQAIEKLDLKHPERLLPTDQISELLQSECRTLLEESLAKPDIASTLSGLIDLDDVMAGAIKRATPDLLRCGSDRRTLLFAPNEQPSGTVDKLRAARPLAAVIAADVDDVVLVSESAGVSPHSLASGLERVFPGIADAAHRLLTRVDVEWQSLRQTGCADLFEHGQQTQP